MTRVVAAAAAIAIAAVIAGCREAAPPDPHDAMTQALMRGVEPLSACVTAALADRDDFDGNLGRFIVNRELDGQLQKIAKRYLGDATDLAGLSPPERATIADRTMRELARYAGEPVVGADRVRRAMSVVEGMSLTAFATDIDCAPSDELGQAMLRAEKAYLTADRAPPKP